MNRLAINGEITPPTHLATCAMVTLRVGLGVALGDAGGVGTGRDAVADGDLLWPDEDVLDEQLEDPAALAGAGGGCLAAQLGQEAFQVAGELEVGIAVGGLGLGCFQLGPQAGFPRAAGACASASRRW